MQDAMNSEAISDFVRSTLGCSCPDEVFSRIEWQEQIRIPDCKMNVTQILIGRRLLVFVISSDDGIKIQSELPKVIAHGKRERDLHGYNRCRLAIATDDPTTIGPLAEEAYRSCRELDEKIYLHIVSSDQVTKLYEVDGRAESSKI